MRVLQDATKMDGRTDGRERLTHAYDVEWVDAEDSHRSWHSVKARTGDGVALTTLVPSNAKLEPHALGQLARDRGL
jgi:hypothetical protein